MKYSYLILSLFIFSCTGGNGELSINVNDMTSRGNGTTDTGTTDTGTTDTGTTDTGTTDTGTTDTGTTDTGTTDTGTTTNEIFIDFSNTTDLTDHFDLFSKSSYVFTQTATHLYTGSNSAQCTSSSTHGACWQISKQTFNLPISIELDFAAGSTYYTGTGFSINLYEGTPTRDAYYGRVTAATNLVELYWTHSYDSSAGYTGKYIKGYHGISQLALPLTGGSSANLSNYGKMLLEITAEGAFTFTYTEYDASGNYLNEHVDSGNLTVTPTNFKIELHQKNHSSGKTLYYDNLKITY